MNAVSAGMSRFSLTRNRSCFLLGASWSHDRSWSSRMTHIYLGPLLLTVRAGKVQP